MQPILDCVACSVGIVLGFVFGFLIFLCVENRVFAKIVFVSEVLVCLFYVLSPVSYFM